METRGSLPLLHHLVCVEKFTPYLTAYLTFTRLLYRNGRCCSLRQGPARPPLWEVPWREVRVTREDTLLRVSRRTEDTPKIHRDLLMRVPRRSGVSFHTKIHGFQVELEAVYLHTKIHGFHSMWCIFTDRVTSLQRYTGGKV